MSELNLIAGANGSGKSTFREIFLKNSNLIHIDTDAIAKKINPQNPRTVDILAGKKSIKLFNKYIENKIDFSFETTLTGKTILEKIKLAKENNFYIKLFFILTDNVNLNKYRIINRVALGGHFISEIDIERRYKRSFENLINVLNLSDESFIYLNKKKFNLLYYFKNFEYNLATKQEFLIPTILADNLKNLTDFKFNSKLSIPSL